MRPTRWIGAALAGAGLVYLVGVLNAPSDKRLDSARQALAEAGFVHAELARGQSHSEMSKCEVGQVWKRGYAYAWQTESAKGIVCMRLDGRPNRIIVEGPSQPTTKGT